MPVYVDPLLDTPPSKKWPYPQSCHLTADSDDELHTFAAKLGLKRAWFQGAGKPNQSMHHYDLTASKRVQAVKLGAKELTTREMGERIRAGYKK